MVPPDKIQEREILSSSGATDGRRQIPSDESEFSNAPIWRFYDGELEFDTYWVDNANDNYGAASGFLPKSFLTKKGVPGTPFAIGYPLSVSTHRASDRSRQSFPGASRISSHQYSAFL